MPQPRYVFTNEVGLDDGWYVDRFDRVWFVSRGHMTLKDSDRKNKNPVTAGPWRRVALEKV